jgi:hypothetical protein
MRIIDLLEGSIYQSRLEVLAYDLLIKVREAKKNGSLPQSKTEFELILAEIEKLYVWTILMDDETNHIKNWINSSKKILGIK